MDTFPDMVKHMLTALLAVGSSSILTGGYQARYSPEPSCNYITNIYHRLHVPIIIRNITDIADLVRCLMHLFIIFIE